MEGSREEEVEGRKGKNMNVLVKEGRKERRKIKFRENELRMKEVRKNLQQKEGRKDRNMHRRKYGKQKKVREKKRGMILDERFEVKNAERGSLSIYSCIHLYIYLPVYICINKASCDYIRYSEN